MNNPELVDNPKRMKNIYELVREPYEDERKKQFFGDWWTYAQIDNLTRDEFLMAISDAIEIRLMKYAIKPIPEPKALEKAKND